MPRTLRSLLRMTQAALLASAAASAIAGCERPYVVLGSAGGANLYEQGGQPAGFLPELTALVARRSGCAMRVELVPPERLIALAEAGEADVLGNVSRGRDAPADREFVPVALLPVEFVVDRRSGIATAEAAASQPEGLVGRMRRGAEPPEVKAYFARIDPARVDVSEDMDTLVRKLNAGRITGFFGTPLYYRRSTDAAGLGDNVRGLPFGAQPYRIGWSMLQARVTPADRALIRKTLETLVRSGEVDALLARHSGKVRLMP
ncbi:substrate-binding periplasmic protein [Niveibacterium sp.]|uniref:substrate-binding periplasmic protein n=1 Tax=Niveibacterium sp. TaxID=2017444 RepID=UPI0035B0CAF7